ncbi:SDR family oxidoreductase [Alteromonas sp. CYL-A6]|uniref:SDR family oxidoreductase n=1 Tax=Alteromonas nitratireducens TaxID=3390813 RepID=UPI0034BD282E
MSLNILITGSEGYIGQRLIARLAGQHKIVGIDIRPSAQQTYPYYTMDIRDAGLRDVMTRHQITHVVHLASVMQASSDRARDYDIDVNGTRNVLRCCIDSHVSHITVSSSGAAYGYHADNPSWLNEQHPLRGNDHFAYSQHKRLIEEMLADYRSTHPNLNQLVLRPGTVLGKYTRNQITNLFTKSRLLGVKGSPSPFVFIWDEDVVNIIIKGVTDSKTGQFNLAGDGAMTMAEIAKVLDKPLIQLPASLLSLLLKAGHALGLTRYSAEQLDFLRYRPVLDNRALKAEFGYVPQKNTREVFDFYLEHNLKRKLS